VTEEMKPERQRIEVHDLMQQGYVYLLTEPVGQRFHPNFRPQLTPKQMLELGVFGGRYMTDCAAGYPSDWFANAKLCRERHEPGMNLFGVNASQPLSEWRARGWIYDEDPRGGSSGTAATSWEGGVRTTSGRFDGGRPFGGMGSNWRSTVGRVTGTAAASKDRCCSAGPMTRERCEKERMRRRASPIWAAIRDKRLERTIRCAPRRRSAASGGSGVRRKGASDWMSDLTAQGRSDIDIEDTIRRVLERNRLAVLATQRDGQPHTSLMAFTPLEGLRFLAFATYRKTVKYASIQRDRRVAILVEDREGDAGHSGRRLVLTALGKAIETRPEERQTHLAAHAARHPDLQKFLSSLECEFVRVAVHAYQVVSGVDDVRWYDVGGSTAT